MKQNTEYHTCDLCERIIVDPFIKDGYFEGKMVTSHLVGGYKSLLAKNVYQILWFQISLGRMFKELCQECADTIEAAIHSCYSKRPKKTELEDKGLNG